MPQAAPVLSATLQASQPSQPSQPSQLSERRCSKTNHHPTNSLCTYSSRDWTPHTHHHHPVPLPLTRSIRRQCCDLVASPAKVEYIHDHHLHHRYLASTPHRCLSSTDSTPRTVLLDVRLLTRGRVDFCPVRKTSCRLRGTEPLARRKPQHPSARCPPRSS